MLRCFARNIIGSDNYWRARTNDLEQWIHHHVSKGHGPLTFFITLSCAKNWWHDLGCLLYQLELICGNHIKAQAIKDGCRKAMSNAARKFLLYVNEFFYEACQFVHEYSYEKKHFKLNVVGAVWSLHLVEEPYIYILWL
jgi:hypothetical protein